MALTKSFNETVKARLQASTGFRRELLREAVASIVAGDVETGKSVLRKYINGTIGFVELGAQLERSPKTLMQMLSAKGNPQVKSLFEMVALLQKIEGAVFEVVDTAA